MLRRALAAFFLLALPCFAQSVTLKPALSEPALSPDGKEIAFVSGGDIWTVPSAGGEARILVAHPATESRPLYAPDGKYLAFTSTRTGNGDVYVLNLATEAVKRLTFDDGSEQVEGWSPDDKYIYFSSTTHDISGMNDIFRVSIEGGTPMEVTADRYTSEFGAAPGADGKSLIFAARGVASGQWWRHGRSHLDESEIWRIADISAPKYERLMPEGAKQLWPMLAPNGALYFMSDRSGQENLWKYDSPGKAKQLTNFTDGRVLWPAISADGKGIVFERGFGIWKLDLATGRAAQVPIQLRGVPAENAIEHLKLNSGIREMALSPDGKKLAFVIHGEVFAANAKDGGDAIRVTNTPARESQVTWASDNHRIAYISERGGHEHIYIYDFATEKETAATSGDSDEEAPRFSPDGKLLGFERGFDQLVVYDIAKKQERVLVKNGFFERPPLGSDRPFTFSPDSKWIAFFNHGTRMFRNAYAVPVDGSAEPRAVSSLANSFSNSLVWSPDAKFLLMDTGQRTETSQVARVDLTPRTPRFREDQFRDLFKEEKAPTPSTPDVTTPEKSEKPEKTTDKTPEKTDKQETKPAESESMAKLEGDKKDMTADDKEKKDKDKPPAKTQITFDGIRERLSFLPLGLDVNFATLSPDGKWLAVLAEAAGQENVYIYSLDELAKEPAVAKQLTSTAERKNSLQFLPDSKELMYVDGGRIFRVALEKPEPKPVAVSAEMDVDFAREKQEIFDEGWRDLRDNFFDAKMHGVDWQQTRLEIEPRIAAARNADEMRRIMSLMIGELNASHMGIRAPQEETKTFTGRLGLRFDRNEYERAGKLRVTEVVGLSPAEIAGIKKGEYLTAVEGKPLDAHTNLDDLLQYTIDRKINLTVTDEKGKTRTVPLKPVKTSTEKALLYRDWVNHNREYVDKASGGKLGYVHMFDMSSDSLERLFMDLDAEQQGRKGVVIDVRNNNGGFVNAYAIDVLARHGYMTMQRRNFTAAPARSVLGQRSLELPTILVTNQHSLSDAEDFTEGYRALQLGKVVGEPTAGWIIYTSNIPLLDGTILRIPFIRITDHEGKDMELHPRQVDLPVQRALGESYLGIDSQLDTAVRELLHEVENKPQREQLRGGNN